MLIADFTFDGRTKVKTIKAQFKENFNATLRIYTTVDCKVLADDEATLASIYITPVPCMWHGLWVWLLPA